MGMKLKQVSKILMAVLLLLVPLLFRNFNYGILICGFIGIYIIAISGLDLVFGYCGQISISWAEH